MLVSKRLVWRRIEVAQSERALVYVNGRAKELLAPGVHWRLAAWRSLDVRELSVLDPRVRFSDVELLVQDPVFQGFFAAHRLADGQRGLLFKDDNLVALLGPGLHVLLREVQGWRIDSVNLARGLELPAELRVRVGAIAGAQSAVKQWAVPPGHRGLVFLDNTLQPGLLEAGVYAYWLGNKDARIEALDLREQTHEIQGQELMTQDKVSVRLNLSTRVQVTDPVRAVTAQTNFKEALYRELQLALRAEVSALTLDELLAKKEELGAAVLGRAKAACQAFGVDVLGAGVRDVILPGEMRTILNQVIEADKRAQANLIARREETAATRNLMNTARLLESSPTLMRLKELEAAERIAEKIEHLSVYGGLDAFVTMLRAGQPSSAAAKPEAT